MEINKNAAVDTIKNSEAYRKSKKGLLRIIFGRTTVIIVLLVLQFLVLFGMFAYFEKYVSVAYGGVTIIAVLMALYVAGTRDNPAIKLSWVSLIILLPVFGSLLYVFVYAELGHRVVNRMYAKVLGETRKHTRKNENVSDGLKSENKQVYNLSEYLYSSGQFPVYKNYRTEYFPSGEKTWENLLEKLETAEKFIFLEYFVMEEGEMWGRILEILERKAKSGVEIRVLYDGTCAVNLLPYEYPKKLAKMGIKCRMFSPLKVFVSTHYNNRDHRKIAVIDGKYAFTGGVNLADEYINKKERFGHWKDAGIMLEGEAVRSFTLMFLQMWNISGGKENYSSYLDLPLSFPENFGNGYVIPYGDSPLDHEKVGENVYLDIINTASDYVYIMTPYLIPDNEMVTALNNAAKRNVDIRLIIPGIPDRKYAYNIAKTFFGELTEAGVKIYTYTPGFVHSKLFVSDDTKAVAGTINLDYRSLYLHFENAVYMYKTEAVNEIRKDFDETFGKCKLITPADIRKHGPLTALKNGFLKLIAPLM